jgi:hypothetical protein
MDGGTTGKAETGMECHQAGLKDDGGGSTIAQPGSQVGLLERELLDGVGLPDLSDQPADVALRVRWFIGLVYHFHAKRLIENAGAANFAPSYPLTSFDDRECLAVAIASRHLTDRLGVVIVPLELTIAPPPGFTRGKNQKKKPRLLE